MYRYPNQEHYLNSLERAQYMSSPGGHEGGPVYYLDQPVTLPGGQKMFVTKSRKDKVRRAVPFDASKRASKNQKKYHGAVMHHEDPNKVYYITQSDLDHMHPYGKGDASQKAMMDKYKEKNKGKIRKGKPKGQQQQQNGGKKGKKQRPAITTDPFGVYKASGVFLKELGNARKKFEADKSKEHFPDISKSPFNTASLMTGLVKFVKAFHNGDGIFKNKSDKQVLGETVQDLANYPNSNRFTQMINETTDELKFKAASKVFSALRKNIASAIRGAQRFQSSEQRRSDLMDKIKKVAQVSGSDLREVVDAAAVKIMREGDANMVADKQVLSRVAPVIVQKAMAGKDPKEITWTNVSQIVAKSDHTALFQLMQKQEALFKKAVKSAANRERVAEIVAKKKSELPGAPRTVSVTLPRKLPAMIRPMEPPSVLPGPRSTVPGTLVPPVAAEFDDDIVSMRH